MKYSDLDCYHVLDTTVEYGYGTLGSNYKFIQQKVYDDT